VNIVMLTLWFPIAKDCTLYIELLKQPDLMSLRHDMSSEKVQGVGGLPSIAMVRLNEDRITL
jgi:hypothetical protein